MLDNAKHIEWIDGAKGVAILSVFLLHCIPSIGLYKIGSIFHIGQAVPIFVFVTAYLVSAKFVSIKEFFSRKHIASMLRRILLPFFIVLIAQLMFLYALHCFPSFKTIIKFGGLGPGAYYAWLFIQVWALAPLITRFIQKVSIKISLSLMLAISILLEYIFCRFQMYDWMEYLYRLVPVRYLMVIYLGCIWPRINIQQRNVFYIIAGISALLIIKEIYFADLQIFANTPPVKITPPFWAGYHWHTAFYVLIPIAIIQKMPKYPDPLIKAGQYSWYMFLLQMFCYTFR